LKVSDWTHGAVEIAHQQGGLLEVETVGDFHEGLHELAAFRVLLVGLQGGIHRQQ
jgi:hypothetical protein